MEPKSMSLCDAAAIVLELARKANREGIVYSGRVRLTQRGRDRIRWRQNRAIAIVQVAFIQEAKP
jgi:hypothetical protein